MSAAALADRSSTSICLSETSRSRLDRAYWSSSCKIIARSSRNSALSPPVFAGRSFSLLTSSTSLSALSAPRGSPASSAERAVAVFAACPAHADSARPTTRQTARASFIDLLEQRFGDRGLVLEQDRAGLDLEHLNEHEVLHAALFVLAFVAAEDLAGHHVAHADLLAPARDFALIEAVLVLAAHLLHELRLRFQADYLDVTGVDERGL